MLAGRKQDSRLEERRGETETEERQRERQSANGPFNPPRVNPFVAGREEELQREALKLTAEIAALTKEDPADVFAEAAHYDGAKRQKLNPANMTDDRLLATVRDLRANLKAIQAKKPRTA
jgi:hypothetical protein